MRIWPSRFFPPRRRLGAASPSGDKAAHGHSLTVTGSALDLANTILAGEVAEGFKPWGDPTNLRDPGLGVNTIPGGFGGPSGSGANFLFMDGSVRLLRETTDRTVLRRLSLPRSPVQ